MPLNHTVHQLIAQAYVDIINGSDPPLVDCKYIADTLLGLSFRLSEHVPHGSITLTAQEAHAVRTALLRARTHMADADSSPDESCSCERDCADALALVDRKLEERP